MELQDLGTFRNRLLEERRRLTEAIEETAESLRHRLEVPDGESKVPTHRADLDAGRTDSLRETEQTLEDRVRAIDRALGKIASGTYGRCDSCGAPISRERLAAVPEADRCLRCASPAEGG
jgi:RNA polymerase-binding protein DksA